MAPSYINASVQYRNNPVFQRLLERCKQLWHRMNNFKVNKRARLDSFIMSSLLILKNFKGLWIIIAEINKTYRMIKGEIHIVPNHIGSNLLRRGGGELPCIKRSDNKISTKNVYKNGTSSENKNISLPVSVVFGFCVVLFVCENMGVKTECCKYPSYFFWKSCRIYSISSLLCGVDSLIT